jgi:RNA polymerase sigma factor (sigma-70 family)
MGERSQLLGDFGAFYRTHLDAVLAFCIVRVRDGEMAADLTAEVFAAALIGRGGYRPERGTERQWLFGIAANKVADAERRGVVERRAQLRLGMAAIQWTEEDHERIAALADGPEMMRLLGELPVDQREAVHAHVVEERPYEQLAHAYGVNEATVRKRVSRGLLTLRRLVTKEDR